MTSLSWIKAAPSCDGAQTTSEVVVVKVIKRNCLGPEVNRCCRENAAGDVVFEVPTVIPQSLQVEAVVLMPFRCKKRECI